jgi:hypothetical protein
MTIANVSDGESGLSVRTKINDGITQLNALGNAQTLDVGTTANTVAVGDDGRFNSVPASSLTPAGALIGTESVAIERGTEGLGTTTDALVGNPLVSTLGLSLDRSRGFSNFTKTRQNFVGTNGALCDLEPYTAHFSGTAAAVTQPAGALGLPAIQLNPGTTTTGHSALTSVHPIKFNSALSLSQRAVITLFTVANTGTLEFTVQYGFIRGAPGLAAEGIYFEYNQDNPNWFACVKNAADTTRVNTGIAVIGFTSYVLDLRYSADGLESQFLIDNVALPPIVNGTRVVALDAALTMTVSTRKTLGAFNPAMFVERHYFDLQTPAAFYYN